MDIVNKMKLQHLHKELHCTHPLYPVKTRREEGFLAVSALHTLYYALYGNPEGIPVVILHGGPCAGCDDALTRFFNLEHWNVVMFDQRGAMRSQPFACMEENTPQHSVQDIETLRLHLGIQKWAVFGGSWGSTLGILYGQVYPQSCTSFILRGIFLGREQDYMHLLYAMGKIFPEAYQEMLQFIPQEERHDLLTAYYRRIMDPNPAVHLPAARAFIRYDMICATHLPNPDFIEQVAKNEKMIVGMTRAFFYYSMHKFFLEPNQLLNQMHKITEHPALLIHGRWDAIDLPEMAFSLHQKWQGSQLWFMTQGGHSANDPAIAAALATATDLFADQSKHKE